ncbi:hypothetical protein [Thermovibrio sp.]
MRKLIGVLTVSLLFSAPALSQEIHGYEAIYGSYVNYSGSGIKDYGYSGTAYLAVGDGKEHSLQAGYSYTKIKYKSAPDLNQNEFTLAYSNTNGILRNHTFTFGSHYIDSDDDLTDGGYALFFDGTYSSYSKTYPYAFNWSSGLGFYYTRYPNTVDFYVFQLTPHATLKLFSDYKKGALYLDLTGYGIHVDKSSQVGLSKSNYYSLEGTLRYYYGRYDFKVSGWVGQQVFAVKKGGFIVYNLSEKYKGGAELETGYTFKNGLRFSFNVIYNRYKELSTDNSVNQTVITASLGYRF